MESIVHVSQTYQVNFGQNVEVTVTAFPKIVEQWIGSLENKFLWSCSFKKPILAIGLEYSSTASPALLSLSLNDQSLIIQLSHFQGELPQCLTQFLKDPRVFFVGLNTDILEEKLAVLGLRFHPHRLVNLAILEDRVRIQSNWWGILSKILEQAREWTDEDKFWGREILTKRQVYEITAKMYLLASFAKQTTLWFDEW